MSKLLLILVVQLLYVPMLSLRTISMVKNLKVLTTIFGFLEAVIYIFGLAIVLSGEQSLVEMVVYAFGFALGLLAGIMVEQKLAIGYSSFTVNINHENPKLIHELREKGYGVTVFTGEGRNSNRYRLDILTKRKNEKALVDFILKQEPQAFIISYEPKMFRGGYLSDMMKKRMSLGRKVKEKVADEAGFLQHTIEEFRQEVHVIQQDWKSE